MVDKPIPDGTTLPFLQAFIGDAAYAKLKSPPFRRRCGLGCCGLSLLGVLLMIIGVSLKVARETSVHSVWDEYQCDEKTSLMQRSYEGDGTMSPIDHPDPDFGQYCNCQRNNDPIQSYSHQTSGSCCRGRRLEEDPASAVTSGDDCRVAGGHSYNFCEATGIHYCCDVCQGVHSGCGFEGCACTPPSPPAPPAPPLPPAAPPVPPAEPSPLGWSRGAVVTPSLECFNLGVDLGMLVPPTCTFRECYYTVGNCTGCYGLDPAWLDGSQVPDGAPPIEWDLLGAVLVVSFVGLALCCCGCCCGGCFLVPQTEGVIGNPANVFDLFGPSGKKTLPAAAV